MSSGSRVGAASSLASAPGKAFVIGEFLALRGEPAVVAAVDRRVSVRVEPATRSGWVERLDAGEPRARSLDELLELDDVRGELLAAVAQRLHAEGVPLARDVVVASDRSQLVNARGQSLGLGSSAASAVALVVALAPELFTARSATRTLRLADHCHRAFQGGKGSGYDVAASCRGGLCVIQSTEGALRARRVAIGEYELLLATGGEPTETVGVVAAVEEALAGSSDARRALATLREATRAGVGALDRRRPAGLVAAMRVFEGAERSLGEAAGISIVTERVVALNSAFAELGGACKPSGAGGDELVVGVVPGAESERARVLFSDAGLEMIEAGIDYKGVRLERP